MRAPGSMKGQRRSQGFGWMALVLLAAILIVGAESYCMDTGPDYATDSNIGRVQGAGIDYAPPCPGVTGVDDQTGSYIIGLGEDNKITVEFSTCGTFGYNSAGSLWVDWNKNSIFDPDEEVGSWTGNPDPPQTHVFTTNVPSGFSGETRARIMMHEGGSLPLDPCGTFGWGSTIDVTVGSGKAGQSGGGGGSGGLSGGSVFLIIVLVLSVVYVAGGCVYNRKRKGTTGMLESCPHSEFWCLLPGLTMDGCRFTNQRCLQPTIAKIRGQPTSSGADYEEL